jgi:uncharacterized membrane protein
MPFCTTCGSQVADTDTFCARCGSKQAAPRPAGHRFMNDVSARTASMACYIPIIGWIPAVAVLATRRFQHDRVVRFHAFQGLYIFVVWLLIKWVLDPFAHMVPGPDAMTGMVAVMYVVVFGAWIWMIVKTSQQEMFRLPIIGDLAERSVAEQR